MLATHAFVHSFIILTISYTSASFTTGNSIILTDSELDDYEAYLRTELTRVENEKKIIRLKRSIDSDVTEKIEKTVSFLTRILPFQLKKDLQQTIVSQSEISTPVITTTESISTSVTSGTSTTSLDSSNITLTTDSSIIDVSTTILSTTISLTTLEPSSQALSSVTSMPTTTVSLSSSTDEMSTSTNISTETDQLLSQITTIENNEDATIELLAANRTLLKNDLDISNLTTLEDDIISLSSVIDDEINDNSTIIESTTTETPHISKKPTNISLELTTSSPSYAADAQATIRFRSNIITNISSKVAEHCQQYTQPQLVAELKQKGTYNPDLMAWDAMGILRFIEKTVHDQYQKEVTSPRQLEEIVEKNTRSLKSLLSELNVTCTVADDSVRSRLRQLSLKQFRRSIISPSLRRTKRMNNEDVWMSLINATLTNEQHRLKDYQTGSSKQRLIGESHAVPFGCDKRGSEEDGYLRLCGACQTIRHLPDTFFPPFINEVTCDTDKACLYFYDYPHGKCRQRHMNFFVLRNVGTKECQVWKKYNLNVRVSCECFVDEMSFFSKYV